MPLDKMGRTILDQLGRDARMSWQALGRRVPSTHYPLRPLSLSKRSGDRPSRWALQDAQGAVARRALV